MMLSRELTYSTVATTACKGDLSFFLTTYRTVPKD